MKTESLILAHYDPQNVRTWFYFPIYMPLNKNGEGPETRPGKVSKETWEVWDQFCRSLGSFDYLPDAINKAMSLNKQLLEGKTIDQISRDTKEGY